MATPERMVAPVQPADAASERRRRLEATDKLEPHVTVVLKGKEYRMEFNNRAVKNIMKDTGSNIIAAGLTELDMTNPEHIGVLMLRGLETHHPELTQDDVDTLFTYKHYAYITMKIRESLLLYMPDMSDVFEEAKKEEGEGGASVKDPT